MRTIISTFLLFCLCLTACQQPNDPPIDPPIDPGNPPGNPPHPSSKDSIYLLSHTSGGSNSGSEFNFEYNAAHKLVKFYVPYQFSRNSPMYVYYSNDRVSHLIFDVEISSTTRHRYSAVFQYGSNGKCSKVYYKGFSLVDNPELDSPYFTDLTDDRVLIRRDSLVYSPTNQLLELHELNKSRSDGPYFINTTVKFLYSNTSDTSLHKLEWSGFDSEGNMHQSDNLFIQSDSVLNPLNTQLWFLPFTWKLTSLANEIPGALFSFRTLFNNPSTNLDGYLPLTVRRVQSYQVVNSWGANNYTSKLVYAHTPDSLRLHVEVQYKPYEFLNYDYVRVKR